MILKSRFVELIVSLLLMLYPGLMFAVKGGMNGSFLLLLLLSVAALVFTPRDVPPVRWDRETTYYLFAMAALPAAIFISQSYHHGYDGHPYDAASRFLLAVPVFMCLQRMKFSVISRVQYGFPVAAITGLLMSHHIAGGRYGIATLDLIHFGDFELILGMLSVLSINWTGRDALLLRILKIMGFLAGVYTSIASGSRGGWIALPIFLVIFMYFRHGKFPRKATMALLTTFAVMCFTVYAVIPTIHQKVNETVDDLAVYHRGNPDTSTGIRLQLYQAAVEIISKNPIFGVGPDGFAREMDAMASSGKITVVAASYGKGEVHNELLSKTAALGIFGLIAMLSIYLVPLRMFYHAMRSNSGQVRQSGMMGIIFVSGFMVFGLTVEVLNLTMAAAFFSLTVAVLLAACYNIYHSDQAGTS